MQYYRYIVRVFDPVQCQEIVYDRIKAPTDGSAIVQAKDGYTGLLGNVEPRQARLEVEILDKTPIVL